MTIDNWVNFSWDGLPVRRKNENFKVEFNGKCDIILPFHESCDIVAQDLNKKYDNLFLALSGGADSECIANCLLRNNIPFTPIILQFNDYTSTETWYALRWCEKNNISPYIFKLNYKDVSTRYKEILNKLRPRLIIGAYNILIMEEVERLNGNLVTGAQVEYHPDESLTALTGIPKDYKGFIIDEDDAYIQVVSPNRHPPPFYYWSPAMLASIIVNWDTSLQMPEAKAKLYVTLLRPKFVDYGFLLQAKINEFFTTGIFGTIDCALIGDKEQLLMELTNNGNI